MSTTKKTFWGGAYGCWQLIWVPHGLPEPNGLIDDWPHSPDGLAIIQRTHLCEVINDAHGARLGTWYWVQAE